MADGDVRLRQAERALEAANQKRDNSANARDLLRSGEDLLTAIGAGAHERKNYSISRLLAEMATCAGGTHGGVTVLGRRPSCLESELNDAIAAKFGEPMHGGVIVPMRGIQASGLATTSNAAGAYTVTAQVRDLIEIIRAKSRVLGLGAELIEFGGRDAAYSIQTAGAAPGVWIGENPGSDVSEADMAFAQAVLTPHEWMTRTMYSRKLLAQSSIGIEAAVRRDLAKAFSTELDRVAVNGSGASNQPAGILVNANLAVIACGSNGAVPTAQNLKDVESTLAGANADISGWLTTGGIRSVLRGVPTFTGSAKAIWDRNAILDVPAVVSNNVPSNLVKGSSGAVCHAIIAANWEALKLGLWPAIEVIVDPYTLAGQGQIKVTGYHMADVGLPQPAQFAAILDAKTS